MSGVTVAFRLTRPTAHVVLATDLMSMTLWVGPVSDGTEQENQAGSTSSNNFPSSYLQARIYLQSALFAYSRLGGPYLHDITARRLNASPSQFVDAYAGANHTTWRGCTKGLLICVCKGQITTVWVIIENRNVYMCCKIDPRIIAHLHRIRADQSSFRHAAVGTWASCSPKLRCSRGSNCQLQDVTEDKICIVNSAAIDASSSMRLEDM